MKTPPGPRSSTRRRLFGHLVLLVMGVMSFGGLVLFVFLVVDAIASGPLIFVIASIAMMVFGAPVFVLVLLAATWKTRVWRAIQCLFRRQPTPPAPGSPAQSQSAQ